MKQGIVRIKRSLYRTDGEKTVLKTPVLVSALGALVLLGYAVNTLFHQEDTSVLKKVTVRAGTSKVSEKASSGSGTRPRGVAEGGSTSSNYTEADGSTSGASYRGQPMKYKAEQVIERPGGDPERTLPIGTSFIGRLITGIDTREQNQMARAILPYGGSFDHDRKIEKGSIIFGKVSYPGDGEKAYIAFNRLLFPDGSEFKIQGEALSPRDYTAGITGSEHDGAGDRIFANTGLTLLSGITDALTEKEEVGVLGVTTPKPSLKNGLMNGLTKSTSDEAQREGAKMTGATDFVTIPAGSDVIISLTETFRGEKQ